MEPYTALAAESVAVTDNSPQELARAEAPLEKGWAKQKNAAGQSNVEAYKAENAIGWMMNRIDEDAAPSRSGQSALSN